MCAGGYVLAGARARERLSTSAYAVVCYSTCALVLAVAALIVRVPLAGFSARDWWLIAAITFVAQLLGHTLFNLVVPMYPMDGARIAQELLWSRIGYKRSLLIAANVGLITAIVLGVYSLYTWDLRMVGLALFGASTCYGERVRAKSMEEEPEWFYDTDKGYGAFEEPKKPKGPTRAERRADKAARTAQSREREVQASLDAILDKIRDKGIASLSARERSLLSEATERRRSEGSGSKRS
jgi:hypothetical protein